MVSDSHLSMEFGKVQTIKQSSVMEYKSYQNKFGCKHAIGLYYHISLKIMVLFHDNCSSVLLILSFYLDPE